MKKYLILRPCTFQGKAYHPRYTHPSGVVEFPDDVEVPHHFQEIEAPVAEVLEKKAPRKPAKPPTVGRESRNVPRAPVKE